MISCVSASDVSGPVAMMVISSWGIEVTSSRTIWMFGCSSILSVIISANFILSTDSAAPAGTRVAAAAPRTSEPPRRSSSFSRYGADPGSSVLSEFEQTISASLSVLCAGVCWTGRISCRQTLLPFRLPARQPLHRRARRQLHSLIHPRGQLYGKLLPGSEAWPRKYLEHRRPRSVLLRLGPLNICITDEPLLV